ncbi:MAG: RNA polymerase sigma factor [Phycisphaerae bacterium]|nr:RNA polymerase sigma factor [Phycisphaerae bacterium]
MTSEPNEQSIDVPIELIVLRCQQGDRQAFSLLLKEYGPRLYSFYLRTTRSAQEAEDLLQDLFVRLLEKIKLYKNKGEGRFDSWLFCVAANLARDRARKTKRYVKLDDFGSENVDMIDLLADEGPGPPEVLGHREERDELFEALGQLSPMDREIIMMRHFGQLSFKEISKELQIPIGTALAKVHRGLKKLRRILHDHEIAK